MTHLVVITARTAGAFSRNREKYRLSSQIALEIFKLRPNSANFAARQGMISEFVEIPSSSAHESI